MEIQVCGEDVKILKICKRLDSATSPEIDQAVKAVIEKGANRIIFDFSGTEYVSSLGLRIVLSTAKTLGKSGGKFAVCSLSPAVSEVFDMAGFNTIIKLCASQQEALESVKPA